MRIFALILVGLLAINSHAGFLLSVGSNVPLLANTANQAVDVFLTSDSAGDPALKGMNLGVYLGDDLAHVLAGDQGVFQGPAVPNTFPGVQMTGGGYFWDLGPGSTQSGNAPVVGALAVAETGVTFNGGGSQSVGSGNIVKIATLRIDTTGLNSGTFRISLNDPFNLGGAFTQTSLIDFNNNNVVPSFTNGSFTITAVPEPSSMALVGLVVAGVACRKRMRKQVQKRDAAT